MDGLTKAGRNLTVDSFIAGMEQVKNLTDIFNSPPFTYGPMIRQGSNKSFLVQVKGGHWTSIEKAPLGY